SGFNHRFQDCLPASRGLTRKNDCANAVGTKNAATLRESLSQLALVEGNVLLRVTQFVRTVNNNLLCFRNFRAAQQLSVNLEQSSTKPNKEEVGKVSIRHGIVIGRVSNEGIRRVLGKWVFSCGSL